MSSTNKPEETITIADRFRGPPRSGNGGYVGGRFAGLLGALPDGAAEVTLRSPVPLDTPMTVERQGDNHVSVMSGDTLVAEVVASKLKLDVPKPPGFEDALRAQSEAPSLQVREGFLAEAPAAGAQMPAFQKGARGFHPICFCCGADHDDGLNVFASRISDGLVAAAWQTQKSWANEEGNLPDAFLWTALDCPGQIAFAVEGVRTGLLGRITAAVHRPAPAGKNYVVTAWPVTIEGKKHFAGSAVFDEDNNLIASALSVWIGRRT